MKLESNVSDGTSYLIPHEKPNPDPKLVPPQWLGEGMSRQRSKPVSETLEGCVPIQSFQFTPRGNLHDSKGHMTLSELMAKPQLLPL